MTERLVLLIVEDNDQNLKLARDVLEYAGFRRSRRATARRRSSWRRTRRRT